MSEENKIRDAIDAAKGLVEAVPLYQDAFQPAAQEIGKGLQTVAKTVHVVLAPISTIVWGYDKISEYVTASLAERLQKVPRERLITPPPNVAGPALEALRFSGPDPALRELYANLLATAIDANTAREAHPAFVDIIRQMTSDEAKIVRLFALSPAFPLITIRANLKDGGGGVDVKRHFTLLGEEAGCTCADLAPNYLDNLCRLGLCEIPRMLRSMVPGVYEPLENHSMTKAIVAAISEMPDKEPEIVREVLKVTDLGRQFCNACVIEGDRA